MGLWYDGCKLLSLNDLTGRKPEIYMATGNRTGGKTTYFTHMLVNNWFKQKYRKLMFLYRYNYEIDNVSDIILKDVDQLFFGGKPYYDKTMQKGVYKNIYYDGKHLGYATDLGHYESIKKLSHLFSDVDAMFFDEFQSEKNKYLPDELHAIQSIHQSVARGSGKHVRYVPLFMCANTITLYNPYFLRFGIPDRLQNDTKYLRGNGWVFEQSYNDVAAQAVAESGFSRAFNDDYVLYSTQNVYLHDDLTFISKPKSRGKYICTIKSDGNTCGVYEHADDGLIYVDNNFDKTFKIKLSATAGDMDVNFVMLKRYSYMVDVLRYYFDHGCVRFKSPAERKTYLQCIKY